MTAGPETPFIGKTREVGSEYGMSARKKSHLKLEELR